jgi:hypothetical protein
MYRTFININKLYKFISREFARNYKNDSQPFRIERFKPNDSKYSIKSQNDNLVIEGFEPVNEDTGTNIPEYLNKDPKSKEDNSFAKLKNNIVERNLKPGKKMTLPKKVIQFKPKKEERIKMRKEQQAMEAEKEKKLIEGMNNETSVDRNNLKYVALQKQLISRQLSTIKRETIRERKKLFNTENLIDFKTPERLSKRLARLGITSRHQAEKLIELGMVKVNGKTANENLQVDDTSQIQVYSKTGYKTPIPQNTKIWLFHKPIGLVSTYNDPHNRPTIYTYLKTVGFNLKHYIIVVSFINI